MSLYRVHFSIYATVAAADEEAAHMAMQRALWDVQVDGQPLAYRRRSIQRIPSPRPFGRAKRKANP